MIVPIIIGAFLLLVLLILFLPLSVMVDVEKQFFLKIKILGIKLYEMKPDSDEKSPTKTAEEKTKTAKKTNENSATDVFVKIKKEQGFVAAVKSGMELASRMLSNVKRYLRHISIEKVKLDITIASDDAAKTAIEYGIVCQAVYPVTAFLNSFANVKWKQIDVTSDFQSVKPSFGFAATVKMRIIYLIIIAIKCYNEWKNFLTETNEKCVKKTTSKP